MWLAMPDSNHKTWEIDGVQIFRAIGFGVGLTSFMVGTALFMIGFSVPSTPFLDAGCVLYSLALVSIGGRVALRKLNPSHEVQVLWIILGSAVCAVAAFELLQWLLELLGFASPAG